jgi:integrase
MAEEIKLDENITIRDAFKITGRDTKTTTNPKTKVQTTRPNPILKNLEKAGISLDSPFSVFQDENTSIKLAEAVKGKTGKGGANTFVELDVVENNLKTKYERRTKQAFPFIKVFGATGFLQKSPDLLAKYPETFKQPRREDKFVRIPEGKISLKNIAQGISEIPDADTRAAVAFNALIPLRPSEITSLKAEDIDFKTGAISKEWRRVNKIRNPVELPEVALSILKNQQLKGGEYLFGDVDANDMSAAIRKHVKPKFEDFISTMGREIKGSKDFRKIIPSIIATELGQGKYVSQIMGHAKYDQITDTLAKMTQDRYLSPILDKTGPTPKLALVSLQNMYGEVLKLGTINELAGEFDLDLPDLTSKGSPRINIIPQDQDIVSGVRVKGELTDRDLDLIEEIKTTRKAELGARTSKAEFEKIQADIAREKAKPKLFAAREATREQDIDEKLKKQELTKQKKEEKRLISEKAQLDADLEELDEAENSVKGKLGNTKLFGKFLKVLGPIGVGISATVASQRAEAEGKTPFEQTFYAASEVLPVSAYDIEDLGKFTAEAREKGIPKALGLNTEKQEQMNIQRKERLARRSERVSSANKPSLDDQINQLLSGR